MTWIIFRIDGCRRPAASAYVDRNGLHVRQLRWQDSVVCPYCDSGETIRRGFDGPEKHLWRYECKSCGRRFDDLTGTALSSQHQKEPVTLPGVTECDETYVVAGHKGLPDKIALAKRPPRRRRLKGARHQGH